MPFRRRREAPYSPVVTDPQTSQGYAIHGGAVFSALCGGLLLGISFPSWHLFPLQWFALTPLFVATWRTNVRTTAWLYFIAGFAFNLFLLQWLLANTMWAGGMAATGYALLSFCLALYWAIVGALLAWLRSCLGVIIHILAAPVVWAAMELLQGTLWTGFGWGALGYAQGPDLPFLQLASIGGVSLLSSIIVLVNILLAAAWRVRAQRIHMAFLAVMVFMCAHLAGYFLLDTPPEGSGSMRVGLLQSNFGQEMKWDPDYIVDMVERAADMSIEGAKTKEVDLILWPEALVLAGVELPSIGEPIRAVANMTGAHIFAGCGRYNEKTGEDFNSSLFMDPTGAVVDYYDKVHLAPFGEYLPLSGTFPWLNQVIPAIGACIPGNRQIVFKIKREGRPVRTFGPLICFEVLFPALAENLRAQGADFLVVITNLAWFGYTGAIDQEREVCRLRAVETRLPIAHCANTGHTGVFDPYGRFTPSCPPHQRGFDSLPMPSAARRLLPFNPAMFSKTMAVIVLALIATAMIRRRSKPTTPEPSVA